MPNPLIAIVGRPNVGKSTFFNRITGKRIAIVEDVPGVTRDRIYADAEWLGRVYTFIDTGGIDPNSEDALLSQMREQAQIAMEMADAICFFVDARDGLTPDDEAVANLLRRTNKPVLLVVNKVDTVAQRDALYEYYALGLGDPIGISSANMLGLGDLLDKIAEALPRREDETAADESVIQLAVIGRPNVGKSSLVNRLLGEKRTMVSDIPGTTRDAIDTRFTDETGTTFNIIDTAGIRRKRAIEDASLERYSVLRSIAAIRRCDVALMLIDAVDGATEQDARIAGMIIEEGRGVLLVINKWDAIEKETGTMENYRKQLQETFKFMDYAPMLFISAKSGQRVNTVLERVRQVYAECGKRVATGVLNDVLADAQASLQPPSTNGRRLKIYYATQPVAYPPTFLLFVNDKSLMHFAYQRYLENFFRKSFGLEGTPIRFELREKTKDA